MGGFCGIYALFMRYLCAAAETVDFAESLIETIFGLINDDVVGAGIVNFVAGEGFLEISKPGPWVVLGRAFGCDPPEIKGLETFFFGI